MPAPAASGTDTARVQFRRDGPKRLVSLGAYVAQNGSEAFLAMIGQPVGEASRNLKYRSDLCLLVRDPARQGIFPEGWALEAGVSLETLRLWGHRHPEFAEAMSMARLALLDFWTRELVRNLDNPAARPAMFGLIVRRFPAVYGSNPIDLCEWLTAPPEPSEPDAGEMSASRIRAMSTEELQARLAALRRRREEDSK